MWDGTNLRCDFRRTFSGEMMAEWHELVAISNTVSFTREEDMLI
jgi:hypothetical protein